MKEGLKVLVVDDERPMVRTFCDILRAKGHEAVSVHGGVEAVARAVEGDLDCVLMDIRMPGMDGLQALARIRKVAPGLPVVLMSASLDEQQLHQARRQGVQAVLSKPVEVGAVLAILDLLRQERAVLVVDDDPLFCTTLGDILRARGFRVSMETDPTEVFGHLEPGIHQVVLLDLNLGGFSGLDLLRQIHSRFPQKPVVLVTGCREEMDETIARGLRDGARACLSKPLDMAELFDLIEDLGGA